MEELKRHKDKVIIHLRFKQEFDKLAAHLRQRTYTPENMKILKKLSYDMDKAWERLDYPAFSEAIKKMMSIPCILKQEGGRPQAARIYSHVLGEEVWVCNSSEAISLTQEGAIVYLAEEILALRGATEADIKADNILHPR